MTRRIGDAAGRGRRNSGRGPKSCCVKVVLLKGKYVRGPASRPPSRCGPSSGKHPNIRTSHPLALECSDVRLVGQEARKRVLELRCPVTVPRLQHPNKCGRSLGRQSLLASTGLKRPHGNNIGAGGAGACRRSRRAVARISWPRSNHQKPGRGVAARL